MQRKNIIAKGQQCGKLTAIKEINKKRKNSNRSDWLVICKCSCGKITEVTTYNFNHKICVSCGCSKTNKPSKCRKYKLLYQVWSEMKRRCNNKKSISFINYGARGISVCSEWENDFNKFLCWSLTNGYNIGLSIDRIENNGNYEPTNCKWSTCTEQSNNTRQNRHLQFHGKVKTLTEWAKELKMSEKLISERLHVYGWSVYKTFTTKEDTRFNMISFNGEEKPLTVWAKEIGISHSCLIKRMKMGWDLEKILSIPSTHSHYNFNKKKVSE